MRIGVVSRLVWLTCVATALAACAGVADKPASIAADAAAGWSWKNVEALASAVEQASADGLDPAEYGIAALNAALLAGDDETAAAHAANAFSKLAFDLAKGITPPERRLRWFISGSPADRPTVSRAMETALRENRIRETLAAFAPDHRQYQALKAALALTSPEDTNAISRLRLNMERWRWMPRDLGSDYILVNVAAFELVVVRNGVEIDRRRIIVGAPSTPTPQFAALATGVAFNPVWYVPPSIAAESVGALMRNDPERAKRLGYYVGSDGGVRQKPGAANSLGEMKVIMPNPHSVFLHDTPAKTSFEGDMRALSHGCIRVEGALEFAKILLAPAWDEQAIREVVATGSTVSVEFERPIPAYVTYFTATADASGTVSFFSDIYGFDATLLAETASPQRGEISIRNQAWKDERCLAEEIG